MNILQAGLPGIILALLFGSVVTGGATYAGATGLGSDRTWKEGVSVRNQAILLGRPFVGGGVRGGK